MRDLAGRVAVVTGGGGGIGRAMVDRLAREGAKVVIADVDERVLAAVVASVRARGGEAIGVRTDVTELASVQAPADRAFAAFGKVHVLCNNAGVALWLLGVNLPGGDLKPYGIGVSILCPMGVATQIRASERNRPADLRNEAASAPERVELMGCTLGPETAADMVFGAIQANRLFVITHEESLEPFRRRAERLEQAVRETKA
ncbi:MAG: hypothetical protein DME07_22560 [Candidatus Rokuibacteriota bacterium]|nr:MAG: hypothetical protein DME07_22560 [Candidatus Rokubacteria bacterium]PYN55048.1 MAG: hypothetical protein DMD94_12965 [Candidatus Rokubacteria bacterium]